MVDFAAEILTKWIIVLVQYNIFNTRFYCTALSVLTVQYALMIGYRPRKERYHGWILDHPHPTSIPPFNAPGACPTQNCTNGAVGANKLQNLLTVNNSP
jgi:hypothetical protein